MSRLLINITHDTGGVLTFGVQSDNADQQVGVLQHQLANAQRQLENPEHDPRIPELEAIVEHQRHEIIKAQNEATLARAALSKAKKPTRRRR